jgi:SEC-C motif-containing protein
MNTPMAPCPCGSGQAVARCCGRFLDGESIPSTAEQLMRSRYTAYVLGRVPYLETTWHASTRPRPLTLDGPQRKWLGLDVRAHRVDPVDPDRATVEFVARFRLEGRGHRLHELSRFVREGGRWYYVDGDVRGA